MSYRERKTDKLPSTCSFYEWLQQTEAQSLEMHPCLQATQVISVAFPSTLQGTWSEAEQLRLELVFIWAAFVIGNWVNLLCHNVALNVVFTKETERKREEGREGRKEGEKAGERERERYKHAHTHIFHLLLAYSLIVCLTRCSLSWDKARSQNHNANLPLWNRGPNA